jgi:DNA gyrase inhibitor GyrI
MYIPEKYPKWKYHKDGRSVIVDDATQEQALGAGWGDREVLAPEKLRCEKCAALEKEIETLKAHLAARPKRFVPVEQQAR